MADKETIRPIYSELQGYLTQAPIKEQYNTIYEEYLWRQYNDTVNELTSLTGEKYDKFILVPGTNTQTRKMFTTIDEYRQKLGGLIARLHGEYFSDEQAPFAEMPSTIISQNQNQSVHVEFILEMSNLINDKMNKVEEGTPEKKFLEKIRGTLSKVKNVSQFVTLVIMTAKEMGISLDQLASLFS